MPRKLNSKNNPKGYSPATMEKCVQLCLTTAVKNKRLLAREHGVPEGSLRLAVKRALSGLEPVTGALGSTNRRLLTEAEERYP